MRIHLRDISLFVFMRDLTRPDLTLEYIRFQSSGMNVVDYCKSKNLPYLEFVDVVNKWNTRYGIPKVEHCMERYEKAGKWAEHNKYFPSTAENMFKELVVEPDIRKCRSRTKYPSDPKIYCELEKPIPGTIVREATLTFPSGVCLTMQESTIQMLILAIVLYEESGFGIN